MAHGEKFPQQVANTQFPFPRQDLHQRAVIPTLRAAGQGAGPGFPGWAHFSLMAGTRCCGSSFGVPDLGINDLIRTSGEGEREEGGKRGFATANGVSLCLRDSLRSLSKGFTARFRSWWGLQLHQQGKQSACREAGNASRNVIIILPAPTLGAFLSWMTVPQWGNNSQDQRDNKDRRQCLDLFNTGGLRQGLSVSGKIRITDMRLKRGAVIREILLVLGDKDKMTVSPSLPWWFGLSVPFLLCSLLLVYFLAEINFLQTFKCKGSWPETIVTNNCF